MNSWSPPIVPSKKMWRICYDLNTKSVLGKKHKNVLLSFQQDDVIPAVWATWRLQSVHVIDVMILGQQRYELLGGCSLYMSFCWHRRDYAAWKELGWTEITRLLQLSLVSFIYSVRRRLVNKITEVTKNKSLQVSHQSLVTVKLYCDID